MSSTPVSRPTFAPPTLPTARATTAGTPAGRVTPTTPSRFRLTGMAANASRRASPTAPPTRSSHRATGRLHRLLARLGPVHRGRLLAAAYRAGIHLHCPASQGNLPLFGWKPVPSRKGAGFPGRLDNEDGCR